MGHSRKKLDLTGQTFGKLTVLAPAENVGARTAWLCRCACGNETVVKTCHLRNGHVVSCGCGGRGLSHLTYIDGTCVEMLRAKTVRSNNTSGVPGVDWLARKRLWRAVICFQGKRRYLGSYHRFEDAVKARKRAEEEIHDAFLRDFEENEGPVPTEGAEPIPLRIIRPRTTAGAADRYRVQTEFNHRGEKGEG